MISELVAFEAWRKLLQKNGYVVDPEPFDLKERHGHVLALPVGQRITERPKGDTNANG